MKPTNWNKRFFESTRGRIIGLLRRTARTVNELAETLDLTDNAVRTHLSTLERDGLVQQSGTRRGPRKPHHSYELTPEAEQFFPKAYGPILRHLLDALTEYLTAQEMEDVLRQVGHRIAANHLPAAQGGNLQERIKQSLELLEKLGGLAETEEREGKLFIRGYSCPLAAAVAGHPDACLLAETLLTEIAGVPVQERCERGQTPPRCCFEVMGAKKD